MAFTLHDMMERMKVPETGRDRELFSASEKPKAMSLSDVKIMFPDVELTPSPNVVYAPVSMCSSLPVINKRGRCFTPQVMGRSYASARHNLVDFEHELVGNGTSSVDNVIGHIASVCFGKDFHWKLKSGEKAHAGALLEELATIPDVAVPIYALLALFTRHSAVPAIVQQHLNGEKVWKTSMECAHNWNQACLLYEKEFIPIADAPSDMLECIGRSQVKPYKGRELAVALGGINDSVDYWGIGVTLTPADKTSDVLAMISGASTELASKGTIFLPTRLTSFSAQSLELASENATPENLLLHLEREVDRKFNELAKITVMGCTDCDTPGGHVHDVLSDGVVVPTNGHNHTIDHYNIHTGTKPTMTGHTDTHHSYVPDPASPGGEKRNVHMHTFAIDLRGKSKTPASEGTGSSTASNPVLDCDGLTFPQEAANVTNLSSLHGVLFGAQNNEVAMELKGLFGQIDKLLTKISTGNTVATGATGTAGNAEIATDVKDLRELIAKSNLSEEITSRVKSEIATLTASGELVDKAAHEKSLADQKAALEKEAAEKLLSATKLTQREASIIALGVDLDGDMPDGINAGSTVRDQLKVIPLDASGDPIYNAFLGGITVLANAQKAAAAAAGVAAVATAQVASDAAAKAKAARKPFLAVGGGDTETASAGGGNGGNGATVGGRVLKGRSAFSTKV